MYEIQGLKVVSLLRVSTSKQTTKEDKDIPAQRSLVREFIEKEELILLREFVEGGISGYKVKVEDRDALQTIKSMADKKEFDILVVYYSDRIGRNSEESPWVIKYLNQKGVRVFSVREGELKTQSQIDKLFTWMTFWQNENESVKISNRSTDYRIQLVKEGKFQGGGADKVPYGYQIIRRGNKNQKGREIYDFEINHDEAEIVELIYKLSIENNMGARLITSYLNQDTEYKSKARSGTGWSFRTVQGILKQELYMGYWKMYSKLRQEEVVSPKQEHLIIIPEEIWYKNKEVLEGRKTTGKEPIKGSTHGKSLLSGLVICGSCNEKMHIWANHKRKNKDGTPYIVYSYRCKTKLVRKGVKECTGQSTYSCTKIDSIVEEETIEFIREIAGKKLTDDFLNKLKNNIFTLQNDKKIKEERLEKLQKQLIILKKEIPNAMVGESQFSVSELKESISLIQSDVENLLKDLQEIDKDIYHAKNAVEEYNQLDSGLSNWEFRYGSADMMGKKALLNKVIDRVVVYKDRVEIEYKLTIQTFKENSIQSKENEGCQTDVNGRARRSGR